MKILFIEPDDKSYESICNMLNTIGYSNDNIIRCRLFKELHNIPKEEVFAILSTLVLPDSPTADTTYKKIQAAFPYSPVILLIQPEEEPVAITTVKEGSQDYLVKKDVTISTLRKSIQYAIVRKKASNAYKRLFEQSPVPMYIFDTKTYEFLFVNDTALLQYQYGRDEFLSKKVLDIRPQKDWERFKVVSSDIPNEYYDAGRWQHIRKNGEIFFVHIYAHNTTFEGRNAVIVLAIDIDKKVKTEEAIQEKAREKEAILNSITDGFYTINKDCILTYANNEFKRILQQPGIDPIGKSIWDLFHDPKDTKFYTELNRAIKENVSVHFEEYYKPNDVWVSVNAYPIGDGLAVYALDITDEKKIQQQIHRDEQTLRSIINNTKDIIWAVDKDYNILEANQAFWDRIYAMTGKKQQEYGNSIFTDDLLSRWDGYYRQAMEQGAYTMTLTENSKGQEISEEISFNPIYDAENNVLGVSCFSRNVTPQRTYQHMIEQQNEQLKNIAWLQSHKVRSHVATILGLTQLIKTEDVPDPNLKIILDGITTAAGQLDEVIKEINIETKKVDFQ